MFAIVILSLAILNTPQFQKTVCITISKILRVIPLDGREDDNDVKDSKGI